MRLVDWLAQAKLALAPLATSDPHATDLAFEAERLWADVLNYAPAQLNRYLHSELTEAQLQALHAALTRRAQGEPLAYITGRWWFWDLELEVAPCTLIPRPDTELLVEAAFQLGLPAQAKVLDLGTGTGAIALTLAKHRPAWQLTAVDFNRDAVALAKRNQHQLGIQNCIILQSDWYQAIRAECFDCILSNPPYIDATDTNLTVGDVRFEPKSALVAAEQGLADLQIIIAGAMAQLHPGGWLMLEHGHQQHEAVQQLLHAAGFTGVTSQRDYGDNWRISCGQRPV